MIDKEVFLQRIALLAGRIGRELEPPVQREYYIALSESLTTEQFIGATALAFRTWNAEYRNWPSPQQLIEMIAPVAKPSLSSAEAFEQVIAICSRHPASPEFATRLEDIQRLGANTVRAFRAAGGFRDLTNVLATELPWVRKRFVECFEAACEHADQEREAAIALSSANEQFAALVNATAEKLSAPTQKALSRKSA